MQNDQTEVRRHLAAAAARAAAPQFTAEDVAIRVRRVRRRQARIGTAVSVAAAVAAAAVVLPLTLGGTPGQVSAPVAVGPNPASTAPGGQTPIGVAGTSYQPPLPWTATVNGQASGVPESLADGPTGEPQFDVAPGETVTIAMTVTVPAHTEMTKFFLGITGDTAGIGPSGPIGMKAVLATAVHLAPGASKFTVRWTVPRGAAPSLGYQLAFAAFWPDGTKNEPVAEEVPLVNFGVKPGIPVPPAAATRLRTQALRAAEHDGDAKPDWIVAVRTTLGQAMAAVDPGGSMPTLNPSTPVYVYVTKGNFEIGAGSAPGSPVKGRYMSAIIDAKTFSAYQSGGISRPGPAIPLANLGPLASLAGGQPAHG